MIRIILASNSPRRKEILEQVGIVYEAIPAVKEEKGTSSLPDQLVEELAFEKAKEVAENITGEAVILGADTVVVWKGKILGKPKNKEDAFSMLKQLSGTMHEVYTGVCIFWKKEGFEQKIRRFSVAAKVYITELTDSEIKAYIASGEPMDKAGSYAIQGRFAPYVEQIEGDYYNIVGLPICAVCKEARQMGIALI